MQVECAKFLLSMLAFVFVDDDNFASYISVDDPFEAPIE